MSRPSAHAKSKQLLDLKTIPIILLILLISLLVFTYVKADYLFGDAQALATETAEKNLTMDVAYQASLLRSTVKTKNALQSLQEYSSWLPSITASHQPTISQKSITWEAIAQRSGSATVFMGNNEATVLSCLTYTADTEANMVTVRAKKCSSFTTLSPGTSQIAGQEVPLSVEKVQAIRLKHNDFYKCYDRPDRDASYSGPLWFECK